ncbi:MAG: DNA repair protein RecN [Oscillospiraceae bacterium]
MLKELYIENLAVIRKANIEFDKNLNVFTGETGAGKSILINGINAVLGQRVTKDIVRSGTDKAYISAVFSDISDSVCKKLSDYGVSCDDRTVILSREISSDGGSVARINSRPSTVSALHDIGSLLINIHGQHDNQILMSPERHIDIIDSFGELDAQIEDYKASFRKLQDISRKIKELNLSIDEKNKRIAYLSDIVDEIGSLELSDGEDVAVEEEYKFASNSEMISRAVSFSCGALTGDDDASVSDLLFAVSERLSEYSDMSEEISSLCERLNSAKIEIEDISSELSSLGDKIDVNGERLEYLSNRRDDIIKIKRKYGELSDVLKLYNSSADELLRLSDSDVQTAALNEEKATLLSEVTEKAKALSKSREEAANRFIDEVSKELEFLNMPGVKLSFTHEKGKLTINGMDTMELLISANKGEPPKPIAKIASGGELSRIMLALKSVIAEKDDIPTMIFDEIDTGVSGRAAQKIGIKLAQIGKIRQVLCVTHLAQIAVMADRHMLIEKSLDGEKTSTTVKPLDFEGKKYEIARIMGGDSINELMLENAEQLLKSKNNA